MSTSLHRSFAFAAIAFACCAAQAQVAVEDAWVRATVPQQQATGAFMRLTAPKDTRLVGASSPLTPMVEVHEMAMQSDVMKMRQVSSIPLVAGQPLDLKPGGFHVMLMGLKQQVKAGDTVPLTLVFEDGSGKRETLQVAAPVRPLNSTGAAAASGSHKH